MSVHQFLPIYIQNQKAIFPFTVTVIHCTYMVGPIFQLLCKPFFFSSTKTWNCFSLPKSDSMRKVTHWCEVSQEGIFCVCIGWISQSQDFLILFIYCFTVVILLIISDNLFSVSVFSLCFKRGCPVDSHYRGSYSFEQ